jgi:hypothetical protein
VAKVVFYRQKRRDGGIRTAIEVNGENELGLEEGFDSAEPDPVLLWWVDLRCEGKKLPTDPERVRQWLLAHGRVIRGALAALAEEIAAGVDFNSSPYLWPVPKPPRGVRMTVAVCALRRVDARAMRDVLADVADRWDEILNKLRVVEPA